MQSISVAFQYVIPLFIFFAVAYGFFKKIPVYDSFVTGARHGIDIIVGIFPYILAIFLMVKTFQASGAHDFMKNMFSAVAAPLNIPPEVFSVAMVKPLSNAATLGIFTEVLQAAGPDSPAGTMSAVIMGSAETTFYVLAVYLGAVGIKKAQYLAPVCVIADLMGVIIAIAVVKFIF